MIVRQGVGDDDLGPRGKRLEHVSADRLGAGKHRGQFHGVAPEFSVLPQDIGDDRGVHWGADVVAQLGVFEELSVQQLLAAHGHPTGGRERGNAQTHHSTRARCGGQRLSGTNSSLGGGSDIAAQGRVDAAGHEVDRSRLTDERIGQSRSLSRLQMPGIGIDDDGVIVIERGGDADLTAAAGAGDRHRRQARLGEQGATGVSAGEVVGDDEDPRAVLTHTIKSSTNSSGMEPAHTAVVMPDQPLMALMPSRPVKRVTTQKYESLK